MDYENIVLSGIVFALLCATVVIVVVVRERMYDRRMLQGKVPYRLPLGLRLAGWNTTECTGNNWSRGLIWDNRVKRYIPIARLSGGALRRVFPA